MSDAERYRQNAEEALKLAMDAPDANARSRQLGIAARWRMMALEAESPGHGQPPEEAFADDGSGTPT